MERRVGVMLGWEKRRLDESKHEAKGEVATGDP
jgi:hypothetical protein